MFHLLIRDRELLSFDEQIHHPLPGGYSVFGENFSFFSFFFSNARAKVIFAKTIAKRQRDNTENTAGECVKLFAGDSAHTVTLRIEHVK